MDESDRTRGSASTAIKREDRLPISGHVASSYRPSSLQHPQAVRRPLLLNESEKSGPNGEGFRFTNPKRPQQIFASQSAYNLFDQATHSVPETTELEISTFFPDPGIHRYPNARNQHFAGRSCISNERSHNPFESRTALQTSRQRFAHDTKPGLANSCVDNFARDLAFNKTQPERSSSPTYVVSSPTSRLTLRHDSTAPGQDTACLQPLMTGHSMIEYDLHRKAQQQKASSVTSVLSHILPVINGIQLVSTHELPDRLRHMFPYGVFNSVQSKCWLPIYKTDDNVIICAPTGSGKTVLLELAMCRLLEHHSKSQLKIIYMAPTKSLCSERAKDWDKKFKQLGWNCAELTGDTSAAEMRRVGNATIIVTTPEKWDSVTRKWTDHIKLVQMVRLFLIDEIHILKDQRGATLEVVVSRMKSMGTDVRFVALSATVPNSQDIAAWLGRNCGTSSLPACREVFGEDFRPVKLQKYVYGYRDKGNDFAFDKHLDNEIAGLIAKHTISKPIMVFCFTRSSCEQTATKLAEWWSEQQSTEKAWRPPSHKLLVINKELAQLVSCGVAFHHAGLELCDRAAVENGFLNGQISVIVCTSTLAVGVNLPCYMVIIKGTAGYADGQLGEYSDLEVVQMLGRAGRPQFDTSALAIIMTRQSKVSHYNEMISGQEVVESTLHHHLIEHLNSEISLGTVRDAVSAKLWLESTFLNVRLKQNPNYYRARIEFICEDKIKMLQSAQLITSEDQFQCTSYGQAMSKHVMRFETMKLLLLLQNRASIGQIVLILLGVANHNTDWQQLHVICQAVEFKDLRMKPAERAVFRDLNKSACIKFPIKDNVTTAAHKAALIIQVQLGGVDLPQNPNFNAIRRQYLNEKSMIFERAQRLVRCVTDCRIAAGDALGLRNALELTRSLSAEFWDNSHLQLRQIPSIGPAAARKLVQSGVRTMKQFKSLSTGDVERALSRNPPFGRKVLDNVYSFPEFSIATKMSGNVSKSGQPVRVQVQVHVVVTPALWKGGTFPVVFFAGVSDGSLINVWHGSSKKLEKGLDITFLAEVSSAKDFITCQVACEDLVGTTESVDLRPIVPASAFPVKQTLLPTPGCSSENGDGPPTDDARYGWNDMPEADVLGAIRKVESFEGEEVTGLDDVDFYDIDDFESADPSYPISCSAHAEKKIPETTRKPERMDNGKWMCSHICRNGRLTKAGRPCSHRCCKEGVDKISRKKTAFENEPRKKARLEGPSRTFADFVQDERSKPKPTKTIRSTMYDNIEFVDLVDELSTVDHAELGSTRFNQVNNSDNTVHAIDNLNTMSRLSRSQYEDDSDPFPPIMATDPGAFRNNDIGSEEAEVEEAGVVEDPEVFTSSAHNPPGRGRPASAGAPDGEEFQDIFLISDRDEDPAEETLKSSPYFPSMMQIASPRKTMDENTVPLDLEQGLDSNRRPGLPEWTKDIDVYLLEYLEDFCEFID